MVLLTLSALLCLFNLAAAIPHAKKDVAKRTAIGYGCSGCAPGPWLMNPACRTGEWYAVASSMKNPPATVMFDATAFCSEFLLPIMTSLSIVTVTGDTTISTSTDIRLTLFKPTQTQTTPHITPTPKPKIAVVSKPGEFTVPEYMEDWYYYGRLYPGCSCIITSASPSSLTSMTETTTLYSVTLSTTITETYTIYPKHT
ncbi:hypothetical protein BJ875DRAFT_489142 [Amylocarpus encephaloides]|uniref:Uncharacterized protein n=1 Tax=Amylocarpus encephaloides TaxID=45428 RepID=A0A9P8C0B8_9HELO|nr:hypothetical protein BJ875DRAFT_489142 [Amylocarpus encephaloides]